MYKFGIIFNSCLAIIDGFLMINNIIIYDKMFIFYGSLFSINILTIMICYYNWRLDKINGKNDW